MVQTSTPVLDVSLPKPSEEATFPDSISKWQKSFKPPISEEIVKLIAQRASGVRQRLSFGTTIDSEAIGFESLLPSISRPSASPSESFPRVSIGSSQCLQPYKASPLNCSALSFGPMSKSFILAMSQAAFLGDFYLNTGEAGLSPYHFGVDVDIESSKFNTMDFFKNLAEDRFLEAKTTGDLVWQIGTGYFSCRNQFGGFDAEQFRLKAKLPQVKMIELKISQGVEPCKEMPVKEVTIGMTRIMGISSGPQAKLEDGHSTFSTPVGLLQFIRQLRLLSDGKPIGIKLGIGHRADFMALCKAMLKTGIFIDFITVDGMEGGTAAATQGALGYTGTSLNDSVLFVHNCLVGSGLRDEIRIIASGKVFTEHDIIAKLARGADLCATARGMLLSVGCDQLMTCYQGNCSKGIATQDPSLIGNFDIGMNTRHAYNYHYLTMTELYDLLHIAGLNHPDELKPSHVQKRISYSEVLPLDEIYTFLKPKALINPWFKKIPSSYHKAWRLSEARAFHSGTRGPKEA